MRYISPAVSLTVLLSLSFQNDALAWSSKPAPAPATKNVEEKPEAKAEKQVEAPKGTGPVLAKVSGIEIRKSEVDDKIEEIKNNPILKELFDPKNPELSKKRALEILITQKLLEPGVKKVKETENFKKTIEFLSEDWAQKTYLSQEADRKITETEIKEKYDEFVKKRPIEDQVYISIIRTTDEAKAKEAFAKLSKGQDFGKVAKEYSVDENTKNEGGAIPTPVRKSDQSPKELTDAIFNVAVGNICKEPIKIAAADGKGGQQVSYLIFKVTKREPIPVQTLEQIKEPLKAALRESKLPAIIDDLRKSGNVEIFKYDASEKK